MILSTDCQHRLTQIETHTQMCVISNDVQCLGGHIMHTLPKRKESMNCERIPSFYRCNSWMTTSHLSHWTLVLFVCRVKAKQTNQHDSKLLLNSSAHRANCRRGNLYMQSV